MEFNPDPSKQANEVLFSCKKVRPTHPDLMFNITIVSKVSEHKHLGLILESDLSIDKHLNNKMIKATKNVGILKHLSTCLPLKTLDRMYKALVRFHLDYCGIIYHIPPILNQPPLGLSLDNLMEKVERIQYQAALAITGTWQGSNRITGTWQGSNRTQLCEENYGKQFKSTREHLRLYLYGHVSISPSD